jgi:hypothetical protein
MRPKVAVSDGVFAMTKIENQSFDLFLPVLIQATQDNKVKATKQTALEKDKNSNLYSANKLNSHICIMRQSL